MNPVSNTVLIDRHTYLLKKYITEGVTEILVNKPEEVWVEKNGVYTCFEEKELSYVELETIASTIAGQSFQQVGSENPLLSTTLPKAKDGSGGERVQIVMPPCVDLDVIALSIRVPSSKKIDYSMYKSQGSFNQIGDVDEDKELKKMYEQGDFYNFIKACVHQKKNIVISGGTSTGKTTFINALIDLIPDQERIITIEDSRELVSKHKNRLHLTTSHAKVVDDKVVTPEVSSQMLLEASLRLNPDRIIRGEIRGSEAFAYLRGVNTGHPGSMTSVHADSAKTALSQICLMVMQANLGWKMNEINNYVKSVIDVVVQWKKVDNKRFISEVLWLGADE